MKLIYNDGTDLQIQSASIQGGWDTADQDSISNGRGSAGNVRGRAEDPEDGYIRT